MTVPQVIGLWWICFSSAGVILFALLIVEDIVGWIRERRRPDEPE